MKFLVRIMAICVCVGLLFSGIALLLPGRAMADNHARDYIPAPAGTLAVITYFFHVSGNRYMVQGKKVSGNLGLSENIAMFRPIYYTNLNIGDLSIRVSPQCVIPFGQANFDGDIFNNVSSSGFGAPFFLSQFWIINHPETNTYLAFTPFFFLPIGNYNSTRPINLGQNRWQFHQELNFTQGFEVIPGHFAYAEVTLSGTEYTSNDDYFGQTLSQSPEFDLESHLSYDLTKTVFAAVDYYGHFLGSQTIAGVNLNNPINSNSIGGTLAYSFSPGFQLLLQYKSDVSVENGPKTSTIMLRFLWATDLNSLIGKGK